MGANYVVSQTSKGFWSVQRQGEKQIRIHADTKKEAIKMGRVLSIKNNGKLVIIDHSTVPHE